MHRARKSLYTVVGHPASRCWCQHGQLFILGPAARHLGGWACIKTRALPRLGGNLLQLIPAALESLQLEGTLEVAQNCHLYVIVLAGDPGGTIGAGTRWNSDLRACSLLPPLNLLCVREHERELPTHAGCVCLCV
jgi:hypothetical protein